MKERKEASMTKASRRLLGLVALAVMLTVSLAFVTQRASPPAGAQPSIISVTHTPFLQPNCDKESAITIWSHRRIVLNALSRQLLPTHILEMAVRAAPA